MFIFEMWLHTYTHTDIDHVRASEMVLDVNTALFMLILKYILRVRQMRTLQMYGKCRECLQKREKE